MSENPNNGKKPGEFKVHIDESRLAAEVESPRRPQRPEPVRSGGTGYYSADEDSKEDMKAHKKRNRLKARKNKRVFVVVWLCMVVLLALTLATYLIGGVNDFFAVGRTDGTATVELGAKTEAKGLAKLLYAQGAIKKPEFFELYAKVTVDDWTYFEPGEYTLATNLDYEDILNRLQGGNRTWEEVRVTFPEGSNVLDMARLLEENEVCTANKFLSALNELDFTNYDVIADLGAAPGRYYKLEGYLFPDTYDFWKGEEVESVIGKMLANFQDHLDDTVMAGLQAGRYKLDDIVTLASIIQAEAADTGDMYKISAVLHNRLNYGADYGIYRLECDSTTFYPYRRAEDVPAQDALPHGAYDTYKVEGLPPGPICSPGMDAILAALSPSTEGDAPRYLYFCHAADGTPYYATNAEDHAYNLYQAGLTDGVYLDNGSDEEEWSDEEW